MMQIKVGDRIRFKSAMPDDVTESEHTGKIEEIEGNCVLVGVRGYHDLWSILKHEIIENLTRKEVFLNTDFPKKSNCWF